MTALRAMTIWPAWQHFEEDTKGSIEVGKLADFVILSEDPTDVDPETLADIKVLATIKEDELIYEAGAGARRGGALRSTAAFGGNDPQVAHRFMHAVYAALGTAGQ